MEHWHFIGIGGSGMSVLAHALLDRGATVSGSDQHDSAALADLRARGVRVQLGHAAANPDLAAADRVVTSAAVPASNPELAAAHAAGMPVISRAALLGRLMDERIGVAVAGTAGKTTTTAMIAWILRQAGRDPAFLVGGVLSDLGTGGHWGTGPELVAEADEYAGSFWELHAQVAVITNIEAEHLDFYPDLAAVEAAFRRFAANVRPGGTLICCGDDPGARRLYHELQARAEASIPPSSIQNSKLKTQNSSYDLYGTTADCTWQVAHETLHAAGGTDFDVVQAGRPVAGVHLLLPGHHNVLNALAAVAVAAALGVPPPAAATALGSFHGTQRRFEIKGSAAGVLVVDDYAHHPTKVAATLAAARRHLAGRRLVVVFQPHTYSRTRSFLAAFAQALTAADVVVVTAIYAARESDTLGVSGRDLVARLDALAPGQAHFAPDLAAAATLVAALLQPGDVLLTLGAGDVWKVGEAILNSSFEF